MRALTVLLLGTSIIVFVASDPDKSDGRKPGSRERDFRELMLRNRDPPRMKRDRPNGKSDRGDQWRPPPFPPRCPAFEDCATWTLLIIPVFFKSNTTKPEYVNAMLKSLMVAVFGGERADCDVIRKVVVGYVDTDDREPHVKTLNVCHNATDCKPVFMSLTMQNMFHEPAYKEYIDFTIDHQFKIDKDLMLLYGARSMEDEKDNGMWTLLLTNLPSDYVMASRLMGSERKFWWNVSMFEKDTNTRLRMVNFDYEGITQPIFNGSATLNSSITGVKYWEDLPLVASEVLPDCESARYRRNDNWIWIVAGVGVLLLVVGLFVGVYLYKRIKRNRRTKLSEFHRKHVKSTVVEDAGDRYGNMASPEIDLWEISTDRVDITTVKLGSGAFSVVYKGQMRGIAPVVAIQKQGLQARQLTDCHCAVKMLPDYADFHSKVDFIQEINFMKDLGYYKHLVNLIACVTVSEPICLITEFCEKGDLLHLLRAEKDNIAADSQNGFLRRSDLLSFAWQIADGMTYLSSKGCIHRDLAARNILIDSSKTAKIGDFGLCRLLDRTLYTTRGGRLPIKWMALESLKHYEYSTKSDVWTYGVLLYEMFSVGLAPYAWLQPSEIIDHLAAGSRLDRPEYADDEIFSLMCQCQLESPDERPTFAEIRARLGRTLQLSGNDQYNYNYLLTDDVINDVNPAQVGLDDRHRGNDNVNDDNNNDNENDNDTNDINAGNVKKENKDTNMTQDNEENVVNITINDEHDHVQLHRRPSHPTSNQQQL